MRPQDVFWLIGIGKREASYGAGIANVDLTQWFKLNGPGLFNPSKEADTDEEEITGHPYASDGGGQVTRRRVAGSIEYKGNLNLTHYLIAALLANNDTTGAGDPFTHLSKWPGSGVQRPFSFSVIQGTDRNTTSTFRKFNGVIPNSIELVIEESGPIITTCELIGDGSDEDASGVAAPAIDSAIEGNRYYYEHISQLQFGPALEDIRDIFRRCRIRLAANVETRDRPDRVHASGGALVGEIHYPNTAPVFEAELTVKGKRRDTAYNYWENGTKVQFDLKLLVQAAPERSFRVQGNAVRVREDAPDIEAFDDFDHVLNLPLRFEFNGADNSPYIFTTLSEVSAYLQP